MRVQVRADVFANLIVRYFFLIMICTGCYVEQLMKLYNKCVCGWSGLALRGISELFGKVPGGRRASWKSAPAQLAPNGGSLCL